MFCKCSSPLLSLLSTTLKIFINFLIHWSLCKNCEFGKFLRSGDRGSWRRCLFVFLKRCMNRLPSVAGAIARHNHIITLLLFVRKVIHLLTRFGGSIVHIQTPFILHNEYDLHITTECLVIVNKNTIWIPLIIHVPG